MKNILFISLLSIFLFSCNAKEKQEDDERQAYLTANNITQEPTESGMYYIETLEGFGAQPSVLSTVTVHYEGRLLNGDIFDSSYERGEPITFTLGIGQVIAGWDEGIAYMKKGGTATFVIPSNLAYGPSGSYPIPGYATLVFDIELIDVVEQK